MAKRQSMTERVLQELRNDIINWNYEENDMITEAEISEKFGVSKTPSREALRCKAFFSLEVYWKKPLPRWRFNMLQMRN